MENCVTDYLLKRGYRVNTTALELIHACDDWYANRKIPEFHRRNTVQNVPYDLRSGVAAMMRTCAKSWM